MKEQDAMWHLAALSEISRGKRMGYAHTVHLTPIHPRVSPRRKTKGCMTGFDCISANNFQ